MRGLVMLALAAIVAACGGGSVAQVRPSPTAAPALVTVAATQQFGQILVDGRGGGTLYYFVPEQNGRIVCTGDCTATWLPLLLPGHARVSSPAPLPRLLGSVSRPDGGEQVTYDGWPLYRYAMDRQPGDTLGQGTGGQWFVAEAAGESTPTPVPPPPPPPQPVVVQPPPPPVMRPPTPLPFFNDGDRDNMGGPSDGDGNK